MLEQHKPLGGHQRREDDRRGEQRVQDLAVHVDVVPDEVRVQRGERRGDDADPLRGDPAADLVDEERRRDRDERLREPDHEPVPLEDPVERREEEGVERLRVRRGHARDEADRSARHERAREVVALLRVGEQDLAALDRDDDEPRQSADGRDERVGAGARHLSERRATRRACRAPRPAEPPTRRRSAARARASAGTRGDARGRARR